MAKKIESLKDIKSATAETEVKSTRKSVKDKQGRSYATGKRKDAVARVWIMPGKGNVTINSKSIDEYFARPVLKMVINQPFAITNRENPGGCPGRCGSTVAGGRIECNQYLQSLQ